MKNHFTQISHFSQQVFLPIFFPNQILLLVFITIFQDTNVIKIRPMIISKCQKEVFRMPKNTYFAIDSECMASNEGTK